MWFHNKTIGKQEALEQLCKLKVLFDGESNNLPKQQPKDLEPWKKNNVWFNKQYNGGKDTIIDAYPLLLPDYEEHEKKNKSKESYCGFAIKDNSNGIFPLILFPIEYNKDIHPNYRTTAMITSIINILNKFESVWEIIDTTPKETKWNKDIQKKLFEVGIKK